MDKDLEELQNFANNLNRKPEERPEYSRRNISYSKDKMFASGTKKIKSKMGMMSAISMALTSGGSKKNWFNFKNKFLYSKRKITLDKKS